MSTYPPFAIPTLIPTDINVRAQRVSNVYPTQTTGPYTTWKLPVKVATTANITLTGLQTVDGVSLVNGDRVLVKNQVTGSENGIYVALLSADWQRANDLPDGAGAANITVFVSEGTTYADVMFLCTNDSGSDIVGTDSLTFTTYGVFTPVAPGGNSGDVQYNNGGTFAGSDLFAFTPVTILPGPTYPFTTTGQITLGPTTGNNTSQVSVIKAADSVGTDQNGGTITIVGGIPTGTGTGGGVGLLGGYSANAEGGGVFIQGGFGSTLGGTVSISGGTTNTSGGAVVLYAAPGDSLAGTGGNINLNSGSGKFSGNINIVAPQSSGVGGTDGKIVLTTNSISTNFLTGGVQFSKDVSVGMTIANLTVPPTVTTTSRQGIITITDPSAVANGTSITITVDNVNVLANDMVYAFVQKFNTAGNGIPMVLVSSTTTSTGFTIQLYNIGAAAFSVSEMKISFILM